MLWTKWRWSKGQLWPSSHALLICTLLAPAAPNSTQRLLTTPESIKVSLLEGLNGLKLGKMMTKLKILYCRFYLYFMALNRNLWV